MTDYYRDLQLEAARRDVTAPCGIDYTRGAGDRVLTFNDTTEELCVWKAHAIGASGETVSAVVVSGNISMAAANTSDGVVLGCRIQAISPDNNEKWATGGWATQVKDRVVVDDTIDEIVSFSLTMTSNDDGLELGDTFWIEFSRVGDDTTTETTGDDASGLMQLESIGLKITAS